MNRNPRIHLKADEVGAADVVVNGEPRVAA